MEINSEKRERIPLVLSIYIILSLIVILINFILKGIVHFYINIVFFYVFFLACIFSVIHLKREHLINLFYRLFSNTKYLNLNVVYLYLKKKEKLIKISFVILLALSMTAFLFGAIFPKSNFFEQKKFFAYVTIIIGAILMFLNNMDINSREENRYKSVRNLSYILKNAIILFSTIIVFLLIIFIGGRMTKMIGGDEQHLFGAAIGYLKSGQFQQWNWFNNTAFREYTSFKEFSFLLAVLFKIFGISHFLARLPSLIIGILIIILSYIFIKKIFDNKTVAIVFSVWLATNPFFIFYASMIRHYIFYILAVICFYYTFFKSFDVIRKKIIYKYLISSFIILATILLIIDRVNFVLAYPAIIAIFCFFMYKWHAYKWHSLSIFALLIISSLTAVILSYSKYVIAHYNLFVRPIKFIERFSEVSFLNFPYYIGIAVILSTGIFVIYNLIKKNGAIQFFQSYLYFFIFWASSQWIIIYILNVGLGYNSRYMAHLIIINFLLLFAAFYIILKILGIEKEKYTTFILIIIAIFINLNLFLKKEINYGSYVQQNEYYYKRMLSQKTDEELDKFPINHLIANKVLKEYVNKNTILLDADLAFSSYYYRNLNLNPENYISFCLTPPYYYNQKYLCKNSKIGETIGDFVDIMKKNPNKDIIAVWSTRKEYKIAQDVINGVEKIGFKKVSGRSIDDSNAEIYLLKR